MLNRPQQLGLGLRLLTRNGMATVELLFPRIFDTASVTGLDNLVRHWCSIC